MLTTLLKSLAWSIIRCLLVTYKIRIFGTENKQKAISLTPKGVFLIALWHEYVSGIMAAHAWTSPIMTLSSRSKDGDYASHIATKMGFISVRGSSKKKGKDKGGKEALHIYIEGLKKGISGGLTVDGPRGQRRVCKPGIAIMAKEAQCAIIPTTAYFHSYWEFKKSWDKFKIPKPFSRIDVIYGEPILIPHDANHEDIEQACTLIGSRINSCEEKIIQLIKN